MQRIKPLIACDRNILNFEIQVRPCLDNVPLLCLIIVFSFSTPIFFYFAIRVDVRHRSHPLLPVHFISSTVLSVSSRLSYRTVITIPIGQRTRYFVGFHFRTARRPTTRCHLISPVHTRGVRFDGYRITNRSWTVSEGCRYTRRRSGSDTI